MTRKCAKRKVLNAERELNNEGRTEERAKGKDCSVSERANTQDKGHL